MLLIITLTERGIAGERRPLLETSDPAIIREVVRAVLCRLGPLVPKHEAEAEADAQGRPEHEA